MDSALAAARSCGFNIAVIAAAGCAVPLLLALRVDPMEAIRAE